MQQPPEIESFYQSPDPWGFQSNPEDTRRKERIVKAAGSLGLFERALDIGAGEGWITGSLPAKELYGLESSNLAAQRFPLHVTRVLKPQGQYDLVLATGVLYRHYDTALFFDLISRHASKIVITCNIKTWEVEETLGIGKMVRVEEFPYREFTQVLRIFEV